MEKIGKKTRKKRHFVYTLVTLSIFFLSCGHFFWWSTDLELWIWQSATVRSCAPVTLVVTRARECDCLPASLWNNPYPFSGKSPDGPRLWSSTGFESNSWADTCPCIPRKAIYSSSFFTDRQVTSRSIPTNALSGLCLQNRLPEIMIDKIYVARYGNFGSTTSLHWR